jgi:hypothetical protein
MSKVKLQKKPYGGWENCVYISNDVVDLVVTTDVGPRIIRYGFHGQDNELCEIKSQGGLTRGSEWRMYGGHRLWISPESRVRTYEPDNAPVSWEEVENGITVKQKAGPDTKVIKEMHITLASTGSHVTVNHRLTNDGHKKIELSVWAITVMKAGGKEVIPHIRRNTGLLPNRNIALWPYTRLDDSRMTLGGKFIILRQDNAVQRPLKIGVSNKNGWAVYFNSNNLFLKRHAHIKNALYPDFGVSYETYTNHFMLEMESLSPLTLLKPGEDIDHEESWELFENINMPADDEDDIAKTLKGIVPDLI